MMPKILMRPRDLIMIFIMTLKNLMPPMIDQDQIPKEIMTLIDVKYATNYLTYTQAIGVCEVESKHNMSARVGVIVGVENKF
jgi:hypothetical protein